MSSALALYCALLAIVWLIYQDGQWRKVGSSSLVIPGVWLAIQGSRPVSYWFGSGGGSESNPINTATYIVLISAALIVLRGRRFAWGELLLRNKALFLLYAYLALTMLWSEAPLTSAKRIAKDMGCIFVPLVMLTHTDASLAIRAIFVRVSYVLFPLSIVFIKYFPNIGRSFARTGEQMYGGVTTQKNSLGEVVFVFGLFLLWDLVEIYRLRWIKGREFQVILRLLMLILGCWLLMLCDSKTSILCLALGIVLYFAVNILTRMQNGKRWLFGSIIATVCLIPLDHEFGISNSLLRAVGRSPTLTGRTDIWRIVLEQNTDPVFGSGFYTFWESEKGQEVVDEFMQINSAHNGYLEMYVDGGILGCILLGLLLLTAGLRVIDRLFSGNPLGPLGFVFWALAILYNLSETSFFRLDPLWFGLLLLSIECPRLLKSPMRQSEESSKTNIGRGVHHIAAGNKMILGL